MLVFEEAFFIDRNRLIPLHTGRVYLCKEFEQKIHLFAEKSLI